MKGVPQTSQEKKLKLGAGNKMHPLEYMHHNTDARIPTLCAYLSSFGGGFFLFFFATIVSHLFAKRASCIPSI